MRQLQEFNAVRQFDFGQVHGIANLQISQIDFEELRQILGQAAYIGFSQDVRYDTAASFNARSNIGVNKVEWHLDVNLLGSTDALEIDVLNGVAYRMHLVITQQHLFFLAFQIPVSYTHLTLPTNREVEISVIAKSLKIK